MGLPLFKLNNGFISDLCFGMDTADTVGFFGHAIEAGQQVMEEKLVEHTRGSALDGFDLQVGFEDGHYVVELAPEAAEIEFSATGAPLVRSAMQTASVGAVAAIEKALGERK